MRRALRFLLQSLVRFFFRRIELLNPERVPEAGPLIVVANHPNGLIDPVLVGAALERPVYFLAKSTLFQHPVARYVMDSFHAIPVYRAKEADTAQNEATFERCRTLLLDKGTMALFPEGISHSIPQLQPLKTGAARIALSTEARAGFAAGLRILPVGLIYEDKAVFRSNVSLVVGEPFSLQDLRADYERDEREAVQRATERIRDQLRSVVLEADDLTLWHGFRFVARWVLDEESTESTPELVDRRAHALAQAYGRLSREAPETVAALRAEFERFASLLREHGVAEPGTLALEHDPSVRPLRLLGSTVSLLALFPLAALGAVLGWLPYRAIRPVSERLAGRHDDLVSTFKALLGLVVMTVWYVAQSLFVGSYLGLRAGSAWLLLAPLTGYVALRFDERLSLRFQLFAALRLRFGRASVLAALITQRRALARRIAEALHAA